MLYVGLDLSRKRLDWRALDEGGGDVAIGAVPPDRDGLGGLARRLGDRPLLAVIESMTGARFVHDQLELAGWDVRIADAAKARGIAPLACKTDRIDCWVLAELARRDLVPEIWLPDARVRREREQARFRLYLVRRRSGLKNRIHAILFQHGVPNASSDLFGAGGRRMLERLRLPEPWQSTVAASLSLIDTLNDEIENCERQLQTMALEHRYIPLLTSCPGIGEILAYTIAAEIGEIGRFASPRKLVGYTGLCPRVDQSGERDRRGPLRKNRPQLSALGADRSRPRRRPLPPALPRAARPHARPARQDTRQQDRRDRDRPPPQRSDLAHAHQQSTVCSGRRRRVLGRLTAPN